MKLEPWDQFSFPDGVPRHDKHDHKLPQGWQMLIMKETQAIAVGVIDCVSLPIGHGYII